MDRGSVADGGSSSCPAAASPPQNADAGHGQDAEGAQAVKVAVHIRPLIGAELLQGCKDCVSLVYGEPQVQIGNHSFTFDHVYGSKGAPSSSIFPECVLPLLEGLFQGYNATVLAYGQTGSGKTYTMGTGYTVGGSTEGVIPKVMTMIYEKVAALKSKAEFQIRVSFIEILKEEVHDLLDPNPPIAIKCDVNNGFGTKAGISLKPPIQIRENTNGEITLAGVTDVDVKTLEEMASCLERGSLCRATASTNMNSRSSRSHAIFTITLEQRRISDGSLKGSDDTCDDFLCAKLHLVDLAGSERAKRTGADGNRFKEGVHINKGLLALGNVISALGDDKKRKEGGHVPYRDSKLTRLLQDSLGGNSRTVMIACISPADSNAEETLNTLKYANRARNIQNKPVVNRDPMAAEMRHMRQQVELLQAELMCIREGGSFEEIQMLKQRITWLEASLLQLQQELKLAHENLHRGEQHLLETQVERDKLKIKLEILQSGKTAEEACNGDNECTGLLESYAEQIKSLGKEIHQLRSSAPRSVFSGQNQYQRSIPVLDNDLSMLSLPEVPGTTEIEDETVAKEMEHAQLQDSLDKELEELNKRLEQKEAEMKSFAKCDGVVLKQHFEKKIVELEEEKKSLQSERDLLVAELTRLANTSDEHSQKLQETYSLKVKALEAQILELKKKQESQTHLLKQKQRSDEAAKRLQEEIQRIKSQKVQLQNKIKQESEQFRSWKALREKEVLQLKKEGRRNEFEMHKLQGLHQRQKMVLQRKTEECAAATRRLNDLLESRKALSRENSGTSNVNGSGRQRNDKSLQQSIDDELEVAIRIHEVRSNYEKQSDARAALAKELAKLKQDQGLNPCTEETIGSSAKLPMSPGARQAKIGLLESMLNASSTALVAMASQLSEAEERERAFSSRARWQHVRSMADAKGLLNYILNSAVEARCKVWDREAECKEYKEKIAELTILLKQREAHLQERDRQEHAKEQHIAKLMSTAAKIGTTAAMRSCFDEISKSLLQIDEMYPRQLEYPDDIPEVPTKDKANGQRKDSSNEPCSDYEDESDMDWCPSDSDTDEDWSPSKGSMGKMKLPLERKLSDEDNIKPNLDSHLCCSCGRSSGCKTYKCACRAAGGFCGSNCGCVAKKCANREHSVDSHIDAIEVAEAMETLTIDKEIRHAQTSLPTQSNSEIVSDSVLKKSDVKRAEQVLAKHGADMLGNAWVEGSELGCSISNKREQGSSTRFLPEKRQIRRPLSDIGTNIQPDETDGQPRTKQRKRWTKAPTQTVTVQLVPTTKEGNVSTTQEPNNDIENENQSKDKVSESENVPRNAQDLSNERSTFDPTKMPEPPGKVWNPVKDLEGSQFPPSCLEALPTQFKVGLHLQGKTYRPSNPKKKSSPYGSPLRARNTTQTAEESNGLNKNSSGSPRAPGKGILQEKENV